MVVQLDADVPVPIYRLRESESTIRMNELKERIYTPGSVKIGPLSVSERMRSHVQYKIVLCSVVNHNCKRIYDTHRYSEAGFPVVVTRV